MQSQTPDDKTGETPEAAVEGSAVPAADEQAAATPTDASGDEQAAAAPTDASGDEQTAATPTDASVEQGSTLEQGNTGAEGAEDADGEVEAPTTGEAEAPTTGEAAAGTAGEAAEGEAAEGEAAAGTAGEAAEGEAAEGEAAEGEASASSHLKWYAVNTYSGHENKARLALLDRIKNADLDEKFGEVLIPTETVVEMVKGKRRTTTRKFYPGYMFVQMDMDDLSFHLVKNTAKITGFLGGNKPVPVKDDEIAGINKQMTEGATKPKPKIDFDEGENIRVVEGPFSNFTGIVEEVRPEKQKVRVLVSIFGRATPVELDFMQVEKA